MLFNSLEFLVFFFVMTALYFAFPRRRVPILLVASLYFYMAFIPVYVWILVWTILVDFAAGLWIERASGQRHKKFALLVSVASNCAVLFAFKYFDFFASGVDGLARAIGWNYSHAALGIVLPIGLSFHIFQSLAYVIEVYYGRYPAEKDPLRFALYVMFYPQLVAGPIERPQNLLAQLHEEKKFNYSEFTAGLRQMGWGLFKKAAVADRLAIFVNAAYGDSGRFEGPTFVLATFFFAVQIYCDFSGYSDIALGAARTMGFRLTRNFDRPYFSRSIGEFWRRWHISLSSWFRDYVYVPLGGNRTGGALWVRNVLVTFALSGLWHGANWTFIIWGLLHGTYLVAGRATAGGRADWNRWTGLASRPRLHAFFATATTFVLVSFAWIFFRAENLSGASYIVSSLGKGWINYARTLAEGSDRLAPFMMGQDPADFGLAAVALGVFLCVHWAERRRDVLVSIAAFPLVFRWALYYILGFLLLFLGRFNRTEFIYFQF